MRYAITNTGYLPNSPDRHNDYNIIPSNHITMKGVKFPILGVDDLGNYKVMFPGQDYKFKGSKVKEIPIRQNGGEPIKKQKGGEMNECYKCGGEMKKYQNAGEYFGELTQGMMFDPFQNQDMFGFGFKEEFKPAPVKMLDMLFDKNQQQINQARYPQVERMMTDPSQMVRPLAKDDPFLYKGKNLLNRPRPQADIKLPDTMPGVSDNRPQTTFDAGWGMRRAMLGMLGLGIARDLTDKSRSMYDYQMRQQGNSLNQYKPNNNISDYGDYTLNAGLGSNFRPRYKDGGEYDLSQEEIDELIRQGYDVEFL